MHNVIDLTGSDGVIEHHKTPSATTDVPPPPAYNEGLPAGWEIRYIDSQQYFANHDAKMTT